MSNLKGPWAGGIFGTNSGNVFVEFEQVDGQLSGILRVNDNSLGLLVYNFTGKDGDEIQLECIPQKAPDGVEIEPIHITGAINKEGHFKGRWVTDSGAGGTFQLFPHNIDSEQNIEKPKEPERIYNRIVKLGSTRLFKDDMVRIINIARKDFKRQDLIVTYERNGSEITKYADDFLADIDNLAELRKLNLFIQEPEGGINRLVNIDFAETGESSVRVSGPQETWVVGKAESVRKDLADYENSLVTYFRKHGLNINGVVFWSMLILMPSLPTLAKRAIFGLAILCLNLLLYTVHSKAIPNTLVLIKPKPKGILALAWPSILSWLLAVSSTVVAGLIFWYLTKSS